MLHHRERGAMLSKNKVMHALTILVFTVLVSGIAKADNNIIPLADVFNLTDVSNLADILNQEQRPNTSVYALQRCSGLFGSLYANFNNYQNDQMLKQAAYYLEAASLMNLGAQFIAEQTGLNLTVNQLTRMIKSIADRYHGIMTDAYERTSKLFATASSIKICSNALYFDGSWLENSNLYVAEAKRRGLSCGVGGTSTAPKFDSVNKGP